MGPHVPCPIVQFRARLRYSRGAVVTSVALPPTIQSSKVKTDCGWGEHNTYVWCSYIEALFPVLCKRGLYPCHLSAWPHINIWMDIYIYFFFVRNRIEYTILFSQFCLSPAPREEREVSNVLSSLRFHLHKGLWFLHMQIWFYYYIACSVCPRNLDWSQVIDPPAYSWCDWSMF